MCSLTDICTSAGISGDVWLIFTAASRKPRVWGSLSLSAMLPLELGLWRASGEGLAEEGLEASLFLQGIQHSFQKRKRKTATRATPHTITTTARQRCLPSARQGGTETDRGGEKPGRVFKEGPHTRDRDGRREKSGHEKAAQAEEGWL